MNVESAESSEEDSDIKNNQETEQTSSKNKQKHKKTETQSLSINVLKKQFQNVQSVIKKDIVLQNVDAFLKNFCQRK